MKTIEEKAKAYDEALERAKNFIENGDERERTVAESIFDGIIGESEDEKIRKAIVEFFELQDENTTYSFVPKKDILAWLEKQAETFTKKDVDDAYLKGVCDAKQELEKQSEQKTTDKTGPKFHEGDWVVNTVGDTNQVVKVWDDGYTLDNNVFLSNSWASEHYHLWTIQDAKDGDVLVASDNSIFIFKEVWGTSCKHYIALASDGKIIVNTKLDGFWESVRGVKPSTKEQRDLLFQKMKEAGYEFDFEKKELKKIESIIVRDFNSVFSREQIEEIDKRIEKQQRLHNAKLKDAMRKVDDFPMTE